MAGYRQMAARLNAVPWQTPPGAPGWFYALQPDPEDQPGTLKVGWSRQIDKRMEQHRRRSPAMAVVGVWNCCAEWEGIARDSALRDCTPIAGTRETFIVSDVPEVLRRLDAFFLNERVLASASGEKLPGLRAARYAKGWRQVELAAAAKVNRTTIALIETGKAADAGTIRKLAAALGVEPADLLRPVG